MKENESYKTITKLIDEAFALSKADINMNLSINKDEAKKGTKKILKVKQRTYKMEEENINSAFGEMNMPQYIDTGIAVKERELKIITPKNLQHGDKFILKGEGNIVNGEKGDLYINIYIINKGEGGGK